MKPWDEVNHNTYWCLVWAGIKKDLALTNTNLLYITQRGSIPQEEFELHLTNLMHYRPHQPEI